MSTRFAAAVTLFLGWSASAALAQQGDGTDVAISTHVFKPDKVEATPERIAAVQVPKGFSVRTFATGLKNARVLVAASNGDVTCDPAKAARPQTLGFGSIASSSRNRPLARPYTQA